MLDVFNNDAFNMVSLTTSLNKLPFKPARIGQMGLFQDEPINTTVVVVEEKEGYLELLPAGERGEPEKEMTEGRRKVRSFSVPHIPLNSTIRPEDVQGVRAFGSDDQLETVAAVVNNRLSVMRQSHEVTHEYHKIGAIKGTILDADGTTVIYNLFTEFGVTQDTVDFVLGTAATNIKTKCLSVKRLIEDALGAAMYDHIHCLCGSDWFDKFVSHPQVKEAYERHENGASLRADNRKGFTFADITFEEYRGSVSGVSFVNTAQAHFFPVGVPGLFKQHWAPADFMETANTLGLPVYAKQEPISMNRGIKLHTQSNPLMLCHRPKALVKATTST